MEAAFGNQERSVRRSPAERLRDLLQAKGPLIAPGVFDGLSAKLAEQAGFAALYCTGGGISRSRGMPDLGYTTLGELSERIATMTEVCSLPMIVDIDSGFGGPLALRRAIRLLERAGAAAVHVQDIEVPHRRRAPADNIVAAAEMTSRLQVALSARTDLKMLIIARTDVLPILGMEAAIQRAQTYRDAGADMVYVEFLRTRQEMEALARRLPTSKLVSLCHLEGEPVAPADLAEMGYKIATLPAAAQLAAIHAMRALFAHIKEHGSTAGFNALATFGDRDEIVGTPGDREFELEWLN